MPSPNTFLEQDYTGTAKVTVGTGTEARVTEKAKLACLLDARQHPHELQ